MTDQDLEARAKRHATILVRRSAIALEHIEAKFADAHSHATKAVTDTLKRTLDGRPTVRKAAQSPSAQAALHRLDELWEWLCGPSVTSTVGYLRYAREQFYRTSFEDWKSFLPKELWVSDDPEPTLANIRLARTAPIHGLDVRDEVGSRIDQAKRALLAALALAGQRAASGSLSDEILATWERKNRESVWQAVRIALSDGQMDADVRAGRDLVHPDYLDERSVVVGA